MTVSASKPRHEWFQTNSTVTLTIFKRGLSSESDVTASYEDNFLTVSSPDGEIFAGQLAHPVDKAHFSLHVTPRKVELQMPKLAGDHWDRLLQDETAPKVRLGPITDVAKWDKMEKEVLEEEKNEKDDGDTGMTKAMQALYASCDADAQRAMMKSYVESGGTVLNMNWEEVSKKKVEVSPPDGMEFKKYGR
ncbi:hypothetical protein L596_022572 [Steinernema carpocapsae]|uniref:SGS domain-containing protein n=1 Tax=Steinernema carpocapsae TaxID=34508 RepID=A0A4U5MM68_STECR|nr:hypothetical protein L596_022572 [Steinernema carpocapsae]